MNHKGFTLLELIIVIIISGILASLAAVNFFKMIETSRSTEAFVNIEAIKNALNNCAVNYGGDFSNCYDENDKVSNLLVDLPGANSLFTYTVTGDATAFVITAHRTAVDGGDENDTVVLTFDGTEYIRSGTGHFNSIK